MRRRAVGILATIGMIKDSMKSALSIKDALEPNVSKASAILDFFPERVPKSWEKPARPIVSRLWDGQLLFGTIYISIYGRDVVHPNIVK